jgi:hypothetical protein
VPDKSTAFHSVACFYETGSVSDWQCSGHPTVLNDVSGENILHSLVQSPRNSFKKTGSTDWTVLQKCAKIYKEIRISFVSYSSCLWAKGPWQKSDFSIASGLNTSNEMVWLIQSKLLSDEAWFHFRGYVTSQNSWIWSTESPHILHEKPLNSLRVWCALAWQTVVVPTLFHRKQ